MTKLKLRNRAKGVRKKIDRSLPLLIKKRKREILDKKRLQPLQKIDVKDSDDEADGKYLLPIKLDNKIIPQFEPFQTAKEDEAVNDVCVESSSESEAVHEKTFLQSLEEHQKILNQRKLDLALICQNLIRNPEEDFKFLFTLRRFLADDEFIQNIKLHKLLLFSLVEVFKDISPTYPIRMRTEEEKKQKMTKEIRKLQAFEEALLSTYSSFINHLETLTHVQLGSLSCPRNSYLFSAAVRCLCELFSTLSEFNFRSRLIKLLVPLTSFRRNKGVTLTASQIVCDVIQTIFKGDRTGEISLEIMQQFNKFYLARDYRISASGIRTFLYLPIKEISTPEDSLTQSKQPNKSKEKHLKKSKTKKKVAKFESKWRNELRELDAEIDTSKVKKNHTQIMQLVFASYFRILQLNPESKLLEVVLEGLAKFADLISIDLVDSLLDRLAQLLKDHRDEVVHLTYSQQVHCVITAFKILEKPALGLNVEPHRFYEYLYQSILSSCFEKPANVKELLECCENFLSSSSSSMKIYSDQLKTLAFIKRLITSSLGYSEASSAGTVLFSACKSFHINEKISSDVANQYASPFAFTLEESIQQTPALWELSLLNRHVCHSIQKIVHHFLKNSLNFSATSQLRISDLESNLQQIANAQCNGKTPVISKKKLKRLNFHKVNLLPI